MGRGRALLAPRVPGTGLPGQPARSAVQPLANASGRSCHDRIAHPLSDLLRLPQGAFRALAWPSEGGDLGGGPNVVRYAHAVTTRAVEGESRSCAASPSIWARLRAAIARGAIQATVCRDRHGGDALLQAGPKSFRGTLEVHGSVRSPQEWRPPPAPVGA